jgi:hypothetical protein
MLGLFMAAASALEMTPALTSGLRHPVPQGIDPGVCRSPHAGEFGDHGRSLSGNLGGLKVRGRTYGILEGLAVFRGVLDGVHSPPVRARTR